MPLFLRTSNIKSIFLSAQQVIVFFNLSKSFYHASSMFDKTPQRALHLLKHMSSDPILVGSIHCFSLKTNSVSHSPIHTSLLTSYAKANDILSSLALFHENPRRDLICWNAMINACVLNSHFRLSFSLFKQMVEKFGDFDSTTLVILLSAVSKTWILKHGTFIHCVSIKKCFDLDPCLSNALISIYSKCGDIASSELVFKTMQFKDATSYNSIMNGAMINGFYEKSLDYRTMPDLVTMVAVISPCGELNLLLEACAELKALSFGKSTHGFVLKRLIQFDVRVINSLMNMYFKFGEIESANNIFEFDDERCLCTWNCMINGYVQNGEGGKALEIYLEMRNHNFVPNEITIVSSLGACAQIGDLKHGKEINAYVF
ncbi:hypothetical protein LUZ60_003611 [Juncus effusus]|nr:hypothetical protein LUZ60_003611 [Juncus effusus]